MGGIWKEYGWDMDSEIRLEYEQNKIEIWMKCWLNIGGVWVIEILVKYGAIWVKCGKDMD